MNLNQLRYAAEVAQCGSIGKAAKSLYISQPGISNAIRDLEEEIGITIFVRKPSGVEVTEIGKLFLDEARSILRQADELNRKFRAGGRHEESFTVAGIPGMSCSSAVSATAKRLMEEKKCSIVFRHMDPFHTIESVESGETNIGVISFYSTLDIVYKLITERNSLRMHTYAQVPLYFVAGGNHPLANKERVSYPDLADYPLLVTDSKDFMQLFHAVSLSAGGTQYEKPSRLITSNDPILQEYALRNLNAYAVFALKDKEHDALPEGLAVLPGLLLNITESRAWITRADYELTLTEEYFISKLTEYFQ